jgi:hypothetical protein
MQTAFVRRPDEFGGPIKPANPEPGVSYMDAAEIHPEGEWTFIADDFLFWFFFDTPEKSRPMV